MDLKEIRNKANMMLANFVNEIGLDGEWYSKLNDTPMEVGDIEQLDDNSDRGGCFLTPGSTDLTSYLEKQNFDEKKTKEIMEKGLIVIGSSLLEDIDDPELYITIIHETLHANRDLLLCDVFRDGENEKAYSYNHGRFEQNKGNLSTKHMDASQEILKGSIDTSKGVIDSYRKLSSKEIMAIGWQEGKVDEQMRRQKKIDESLVEIMARLSYLTYKDSQRGKENTVWDRIEFVGRKSKEEYEDLIERDAEDGFEYPEEDTILAKCRGVMCEILLKHKDFELFQWMLDPISYSQGDIHYDFFGDYTKNDNELLEKLDAEDDLNKAESKSITASDMKKAATKPESLMELLASFKAVKEAKQPDREEPEI